MTAEQKELFRKSLLLVLEANGSSHGLGVQALVVLVGQYGFTPKAEEVRAELAYLEDKELVARVAKKVSPENVSYRITGDGRDFLAEQS